MLRYCKLRASLLGYVVLIAWGCGGGDDAPPMPSQLNDAPQTFCSALCDFANRCVNPVASSCVASCLSSNAGYFDSVSPEFLVKVAPCIESASCSSDLSSMQQACYKSTAPTLTPSDAVADFCKAMSAEFFECYYADDDLSFCVSDFAAWSDTAVARAKACASSQCTSLTDCLTGAFNGTS